MIHRSIREWEYLPVSEECGDGSIPRWAADNLVTAARAVRIGGADGEAVLVDGHKRLRAQQVVGILVAPGATLEILPKLDGLDEGATRHCLVRMIAKVFDLKVASGSLTKIGLQNYDLLELIIRLFSDSLIETARRGLPRRYVQTEADRTALRGRLDYQRQFTVLAATPQKLACRYEELSADIALNQIMRAAVAHLLPLARVRENQRRLMELSFVFADIAAVEIGRLPWNSVILDRTNADWKTLLTLAKFLLQGRFQTTSSGDATGYALLFEMNALFEEYVGRMLRRSLAGHGLDVQLQGPRGYALTSDKGVPHLATKPDIVVSRHGQPVVIIDTKWKRLTGTTSDPTGGISESDVYQMMAYGRVYGCHRLTLLYPHNGSISSKDGLQSCHFIRGTADDLLSVATLKLAELANADATLRDIALYMTSRDPMSVPDA